MFKALQGLLCHKVCIIEEITEEEKLRHSWWSESWCKMRSGRSTLWIPYAPFKRYSRRKRITTTHLLASYKNKSERCMKNTAPWLFEKQKILGTKGESWRLKKVETIVYHTNISCHQPSIHGCLYQYLYTVRDPIWGDDQDPDFDDMSSFLPCEIDDAIQYINLGYGAQAQKIIILYAIFVIFCCF